MSDAPSQDDVLVDNLQLRAQLVVERKTREEGEERVLRILSGLVDGQVRERQLKIAALQRAEAAEAHCATIERETIERCAKLCETVQNTHVAVYKDKTMNDPIDPIHDRVLCRSYGAADCALSIRALLPS